MRGNDDGGQPCAGKTGQACLPHILLWCDGDAFVPGPLHAALPEKLTVLCAAGVQVLLLYRRILKAARLFPSIKRDAIIADIRMQFQEHKASRRAARGDLRSVLR